MRTTVDLPEPLFRKTKEIAASRGSSMKDLILDAIAKEVESDAQPMKTGMFVELPLIRLPKGSKVDLTGFDFDDLLT